LNRFAVPALIPLRDPRSLAPPRGPVKGTLSMPLATSKPKPDRSRIDLSDDAIARQWVKQLGHPREAIEAAMKKVGDNCETVKKELGVQADVCSHPPAKASAAQSSS
jgi:hypothetical protein